MRNREPNQADGMRRRDFLAGGLAVGAAYLIGCSKTKEQARADTNIPKITTPRYDLTTLEGRLAKEISKWEPWVLEIIETDYTNPTRPVKIKILKEYPKKREGVAGLYDTANDTISLTDETITNFHHEFGHYIIDDCEGPFVGPGATGIDSYLKMRIIKLRGVLLLDEELTEAKRAEMEDQIAHCKSMLKGDIPKPVPPKEYSGPSRDEIEKHMWNLSKRLEIQEALNKVAHKDTSFRAVYMSSGEFYVRALNSLMNLHTGPINTNVLAFPLQDEDIEMFEKQSWNRRPMFGKAIAKYRLKLEMLKAGVSEEQLKELPYAITVEWRDKRYEFPAQEIKFNKLPRIIE